jgi:excisionase family DNA binding protein
LSTDDSAGGFDPSEWVSQAEAARIKGVTRQAIHKLVQSGRVRTIQFGGRILVNRKEFDGVSPVPARAPVQGHQSIEKIKASLDALGPGEVRELLDHIKSRIGPHPVEAEIGAPADLILETLWVSGELTKRMFRGMISEASFSLHVVSKLKGWEVLPIVGSVPYDFHLR